MTLDRWAHLGHNLGECWNNVDKSITFVHIPKNASSFIKGCLLGTNKFTHSNSLITADKYLIALRDPIERWISGIAQFMLIESNKDLTLRDLINTVTFDDHTELQSYFLQDVDLNKCIFLRVDNNLRNNVGSWLFDNGFNTDVNSITNINQGNEMIKNKFSAMVDGNSQIKLKLFKHYEQDYELINRVKFYGTR
jgi:hypothetical protein